MSDRLRLGSKKTLAVLNPIDYRGLEAEIESEDGISVTCKETDGVKPFTFKHEPGYKFPKDTKFFAMDGEVVTAYMDAPDQPKYAPIKQFLETAWGKDAYERLPDELKDALHKWNCTVTVIPSKIEREAQGILDRVVAAVFLRDINRKQLMDLGESEDAPDPVKAFVQGPVTLVGLALGALLMFFLLTRGIL